MQLSTATPPPLQAPPPPPANLHHDSQIIMLNDGYQTVRGAGNPLKSFAKMGGAPPTTLEHQFGCLGSPLLLPDGDAHRSGNIVRPVVFASPTLRHSTAITDNNGKPAGIVIGKF